jgi:hypothetical protein
MGTAVAAGAGSDSSSCDAPQFRQNFADGATGLPHSGQNGMMITTEWLNVVHIEYFIMKGLHVNDCTKTKNTCFKVRQEEPCARVSPDLHFPESGAMTSPRIQNRTLFTHLFRTLHELS